MKIRKEAIALLGAALCIMLSGCGGENPAESPETEQAGTGTEQEKTASEPEETISEAEEMTSESEMGTEDSQAASSELAGAYQQMAMYIQEGFRMYHVEGEYQAYFGPIEGGASGGWLLCRYVGRDKQ